MPSATTTIRPRRADDLVTLGQVLVRVHAVDGYPVEGVADPQAWVTPADEMQGWTALVDGTPIGHVSLTAGSQEDDAARIWQQETGGKITDLAIPVRLFVDPQHRGEGIGYQLMLAAYEFARNHDKAVAFDVMLKDHDAIRLYEALGCRRIGTITHHHGDGESEPAAVYVAPGDLSLPS